VVAFLERRLLGGALHATATVDVQVREDAEQPCPQIRPRLKLLPRAEGTCIRVLHEILRLLARAHEASSHAVDLITELKRLFLEMHTIACLLGKLPGLGGSRN